MKFETRSSVFAQECFRKPCKTDNRIGLLVGQRQAFLLSVLLGFDFEHTTDAPGSSISGSYVFKWQFDGKEQQFQWCDLTTWYEAQIGRAVHGRRTRGLIGVGCARTDICYDNLNCVFMVQYPDFLFLDLSWFPNCLPILNSCLAAGVLMSSYANRVSVCDQF